MIQSGQQQPVSTDFRTTPPDRRPQAVQARWRRDFPIAWGQDEFIARRELVKFIILTSGAFAVGQLWIVLRRLLRPAAAPPLAVPIARVDELPIGGARTFHYPEGSPPRLLVRTGENAFVAYDQQCTHLLCPVVPAVAEGRLHCPCHNGWFDLQTGRPIAGPPRRPLPKILLELRDGQVFATGVEVSST